MKYIKHLKRFFKVLTKKEKITFCVFFALTAVSLIFLISNFYLENTKIISARGGTHIEAVVGQPRFINPIYAGLNDVDRDLVELLFSGLMKHNNGKIVLDLAESYNISSDGKIYEFLLRENIFWHDKEKLTANDIVFTIETIQNPDFKSPERVNWLGVEVEKISEDKVRFILEEPYIGFLERTTLKILPYHIWKNVSARGFPLSPHNLQPIGSGPYKFKELKQESLTLAANPYYFNGQPFISKISFLFFETEQDLIEAVQKRKITGFSIQQLKNLGIQNRFSIRQLIMPRYFAVFFNQEKSKLLTDKKIRQALNYGTDKQNLIDEILFGKGRAVYSPILPEIYNFAQPEKIHQFNISRAEELLEKAGFFKNEHGLRIKTVEKTPAFQFRSDLRRGARGTEVRELQKCLAGIPNVYPEKTISGYFGAKTRAAVIRFQEKYKQEILAPHGLRRGTGTVGASTRAKLNKLCHERTKETLPLKFSLTTVDQPLLIKIASHLKKQWEKLGAEVEIKTFDISFLEQEIIKPRNYEMLLFGNALGAILDLFPFWHSSQKRDPGLNLALYENIKADDALEKARQALNKQEKKQSLEEFQNILIKDSPAVFLFNPAYLYFLSQKIKGIETKIIIDPSKRFSNIENWYIRTKRIWK